MTRARPWRFLAVAVVSFAGVFAAGSAAIHALLHWPPDDPPPNYGTFLLRSVPSPRIIVDGGSSALWSVAGEDLERHFRIRSIVVGDTAAIPFEARLARLERYVQRGDVVVLALEWPYYSDATTYVRRFAVGSFGLYNDYFRLLPLRRRMEIETGELGLRGTWRGMRAAQRTSFGWPFFESDFRQRTIARLAAWNAERPHGDRVGIERKRTDFQPCSHGIGFADDAPSPEAEPIAAGLARLRKQTGARVFVAWPAAAGKDCYTARSNRSRKVQEVRAAFRRHGVTIFGEPTDSAFPESGMMDTYAHLRAPEAGIRTRRLAVELERAGVAPAVGPPEPSTLAAASAALARAAACARPSGPSPAGARACKPDR